MIREVQEELRERKGIDIPSTRVIVTSDEQDPTWWDEIKSLGWVAVDHNAMETEQTYGKWYCEPPSPQLVVLIDVPSAGTLSFSTLRSSRTR